MVERRMFARLKMRIPLKFLIPTNDKIGDAETVDISATGVGLVTREDLPVKTPLELWLKLPDHHDPIHVLGKVVWSQDLGDDAQKRVGVQLSEERLLDLGRIWLFKEIKPDTDHPSP
jgi:hypothetical protein